MDASESLVSEAFSLIAEGADVLVGSCDAEGRPCICPALTVVPSGVRELTVTLDRVRSAAALEAIGATRRVALGIIARHSFRHLRLAGGAAEFLRDSHRGAFRFRVRTGGGGRASTGRTAEGSEALPALRTSSGKGRQGVERPLDAPSAEGPPTPAWSHACRLLDEGVPLTACTVSADGVPCLKLLLPAVALDGRHLAIARRADEDARRERRRSAEVALYLSDRHGGGTDLLLCATYLHDEAAGPLAERMRARLAALAWHAGTNALWRLAGVDVVAVREIRPARGGEPPPPAARTSRTVLPALRCLSERMADCDRLGQLLEATLTGLERQLGMRYATLWLLERQRRRLRLLASHGYGEQAVGAEQPLGHTLAGIAVATGLAVRIAHLPWSPGAPAMAAHVPWAGGTCPALAAPRTQLAVPLRTQGRVVGALLVEDDAHERCFDAGDEDALSVLATGLAAGLAALHALGDAPAMTPPPRPCGGAEPEPLAVSGDSSTGLSDTECRAARHSGRALTVRYHERDGSVFLDEEYLVRGVAGALLWKLARAYVRCGRSEFSMRELRLCAAELRLPQVRDNLYTRVLLLERRLAARGAPLRIERSARGRFRLRVERPLWLLRDDGECLL